MFGSCVDQTFAKRFKFCYVCFLGLPRDLAYRLASQTVLGAGQLVRDSGVHPGKLKDDVTSPAGSTASGLWYLEAHCKLKIRLLISNTCPKLFLKKNFSIPVDSGWSRGISHIKM